MGTYTVYLIYLMKTRESKLEWEEKQHEYLIIKNNLNGLE